MRVWLDFETYSEVDIKVRGGYAYATDDSTNVICLGWAVDNEAVAVWTPNEPFPSALLQVLPDAHVYAHNATFDFRIWNSVLCRDFDEVPQLRLSQMRDTMALVSSFALPSSLAEAGAVMRITMPKNPEGTRLIKLLCQPDKLGDQPVPHQAKYFDAFKRFYEYCRRDVEAMRELVQALPRDYLTETEQQIWQMTYKINTQGVPVAHKDINTIRSYLLKYIAQETKAIAPLTHGVITKATQTQRIKAWCEGQEYALTDLTAASVISALADPACPENVRKLLQMRQLLGRTSVAKFTKLAALMHRDVDGQYWVHDNLVYHGATPGRWTGRGFQLHNLPRAKVKDPEAALRQFHANLVEGDPVAVGKALIRPMIQAPLGYSLIVSDYSSIENRILAWLAGDLQTLQEFRDGLDQYITMASFLYRIPYSQVNADQRQMGKVIILGCGFGMGAEKFKDTAKLQFGLDLTDEVAKVAVGAYREKYFLIVEFWYTLARAVQAAVQCGTLQAVGHLTVGTATVKGTRWLAIKLPSGKAIYYKNPKLEMRASAKFAARITPTCEGTNPYSGKWERLALIPGRLAENAVQATAREVLAHGMLNVQERMPYVTQIACVHDEVIGLVRDKYSDCIDLLNTNLCDIPWAANCPLDAKGYISQRYKKG